MPNNCGLIDLIKFRAALHQSVYPLQVPVGEERTSEALFGER